MEAADGVDDVASVDARNRYRVQSVDRAIDILAALTRADRSVSLREVALQTGLSKATAFRLLATLEARGLVSHEDATGFYMLGSEVTAMASARERQGSILERALPAMRRLRDSVNETVCIGVRSGDFRVRLHQLQSSQELNRNQLGNRITPLYAGAANLLLLSAMDHDEIESYLARTELVPFTPSTPSSAHDLWARIGAIREQGYAVSVEDSHLQGASVAAPIHGPGSGVVAAVYVSVPLPRFTDETRPRLIAETLACAKEISHQLGYRME
jgi:DNA-binding IclR family transcriptional regulator